MSTYHQSRYRWWTAALLAGAAVLGFPEVSHAHSPGDVLPVLLTPIGHVNLLPSYVTIIYYAANSERKMPLGWTIPNLVSAAGTGALGVWAIIITEGDSGADVGYVLGGSLLLGATGVITATILQSTRSPKQSTSLVALPTMGGPRSSGSGTGVMVAGTF